jgi:hypothetical protein
MRENRPSGSEGGGAEINRLSLPLSYAQPRRAVLRSMVSHAAVTSSTLIAHMLSLLAVRRLRLLPERHTF